MALMVGMTVNGKSFQQSAPSNDLDQVRRSCERALGEYDGITQMSIFEDNLYGSKGKWVYDTYNGRNWSGFRSPPKSSSDAWN